MCRSSRSSSPSASPPRRRPSKRRHFASRKHLLEYDDVMNKQRQAVYGMRRALLEGQEQKEPHHRDRPRHRSSLRRHPLPRRLAGRHLGSRRSPDRRAHPVRRARSTRKQSGRDEPRRDRRCDLRSGHGQVRREGRSARAARRRNHARNRAHGHAQRHRQPVERPPALDGPPEGRHRAPRLRPEGSADRVQEGILHAVPGHDGPHRRRDHQVPVLPAALRSARPRPAASSVPRDARGGGRGRSGTRSRRLKERHSQRIARRTTKPPKAPSRMSRATFSARRNGNSPASNSPAATEAATANKPVVNSNKVGRNDPCPCGSGKKYKKCHGATS